MDKINTNEATEYFASKFLDAVFEASRGGPDNEPSVLHQLAILRKVIRNIGYLPEVQKELQNQARLMSLVALSAGPL